MPQISPPMYIVVWILLAVVLLGAIIGFLNSNRDYIAQGTSNIFGVAPAGETGSVETGYKALHVKLDVGDPANPKVYEFHPTNEGALGNKHLSDSVEKTLDFDIKNYFILKSWKENKCALFTTYAVFAKSSAGMDDLRYYIYYIDSGAIIRTDSKSLKDAIFEKVSSSGCTFTKDCDKTDEFTVCASNKNIGTCDSEDNYVINQKFGGGSDLCQKDTTGCPSNGCCSLLNPAPDTYTLAGGIMCGYRENDFASAKWWVCARENVGTLVYTGLNADKAQYKCVAKTSAGGTAYNWVAAADQGINLQNIQIKYASTLGDDYTSLSFYIANHNTAPIKDVAVKAAVDNSDAVCSKFDCNILSTDKSKDGGWAEVGSGKLFSSQGLNCGTNVATAQLYKEFCYNAKKFSVELKYKYSGSDKTDNFDILCSPPNADTSGEWQKNVCTAGKK